MNDWIGLAGRPALVVGAGGLGGATAQALALTGAKVLLADIDSPKLQAAQASASAVGASLDVISADVSNGDSCRDLVDAAVERLGGLELFVHAVGRNDRRPVLELGDSDWDSILTLNLSTIWWLGQAVGRHLVGQKYGRMVFVSSVSALLGHANHAPYAASKGGINQLMRVMAREWAPHGVTVNTVGPGYVETELTRAYLDSDGHREALESLVPAGRLGRPEEVADAITFLLSDRAKFVTGQCLYIDGGRTLV